MPKRKKKKPSLNCELCGARENLEVHHLLCGAQRKLADEYGLVAMLCHDCHMAVHRDYMKESRKLGQKMFEKKRTRAEFIDIFGKNYLEDEDYEQDYIDWQIGQGS